MKKTSEQKGITLIALIITIIILLILAVVAINAINGDKIIGHAKNARDKYQSAKSEEELLMAEYSSKLEMEQLEQQYNARRKELESEYNSAAGGTVGTLEEYLEENGLPATFTDYALDKKYELEVGDYINYEYPTTVNGSELKFVAEMDLTNYTHNADIIYTVKEGIQWRVIGIDDSGRILLVSTEEVDYAEQLGSYQGLPLYGNVGFIEGIDAMNEICKMYSHGNGAVDARTIDMNDINKLVAYNPDTEHDYVGEVYEYGVSVTVTLKEDSNGKRYVEYTSKNGNGTIDQEKFCYYNEKTGKFEELGINKSVTLKNTSYGYNPSAYIDPDSTISELLFGTYDGAAKYSRTYWLGTRGLMVYPYYPDDNTENPRLYGYNGLLSFVGTESKIKRMTLTYENGELARPTGSVMAIVTLAPNIELEEQSNGSFNIK